MAVYPVEFKLLWSDFEPWTPTDSLAMQNFMLYFLTKDWFFEYIRERLTEVYDRETVDKLMPFQKENYFQMPGMETITDEELKRIGLYVPENGKNLFALDESLFNLRQTRGSLNVTAEMDHSDFQFEVTSRTENGGSNCWAVHGSRTKSGKPILTCDPHLAKMMSGFWYATRLSWSYEYDGKLERTFVAGGSNIGIPLFTFQATPIAASGVTSLNPDVLDLYVEEV